MKSKKRHWYDYLWIWSIVYFALGFFNILFAWLGMIDFLLPIILAIFGGNKFFCNHLCGRGQLYYKLGSDLKCSRNKPTPKWMASKWFRYGFLIFFLAIWYFKPILWQAVQKICVKQSSFFGHSVFRGGGHIREVYSPIGWHNIVLDFTA